jgi:hypothetical protein
MSSSPIQGSAPESNTVPVDSVVMLDNRHGLFGPNNQPQAYIRNNKGLWVPVQIGLHEAYKLSDGTIAHGGSLTGYSGLLERNRISIPDGTGGYVEVSPDMVTGVGKLQNGKFVDKTQEAQKEAETAQKSSSPSKKDAEDSLRNVGKQMKDAMNASGNIEEMEALLELGQVAIDQARTAGVGEGIIKNIEGIRKGLQVKYNNHKRAEEKRVGGSEAQQQSKMFVGKDITELNAKNGGLAALLVENSNVGFVKKVYAALQAAEEAGIPIDQAKVSADITAILEADRTEKKQLLDDLLNEINGCNK